ncbi:MAG: hypothetical protein HKM24_02525, partial [Gammaproteobacteria bacterium]|nr:hypothetical protein [Gammaproteobacteria bacterium]
MTWTATTYLVIGFYLLGLLALGAYWARSTTDADFLIGRRKVSALSTGAS